jgi:hypothetical protein
MSRKKSLPSPVSGQADDALDPLRVSQQRQAVILDTLTDYLGKRVLYLKEKSDGRSCEASVLRCILYSVEMKTLKSLGEGTRVVYIVTLLPDLPHVREDLARQAKEGADCRLVGAVWNSRICIGGDAAERLLLTSYEGLEDAIWDQLGTLDVDPSTDAT